MNPFPGPRSVLILDNASCHKNPLVVELVESPPTCGLVVFLPPYCCDAAAHEQGIKMARIWMRNNRDLVEQIGVQNGLRLALQEVKESGFAHALRHCSYPTV